MEKAQGNSALRIILLSILVIVLVGFFLTHAKYYIFASNEAAAQAQITKMNTVLQSDRLDTQDFYLLHSLDDIYEPYAGEKRFGIPGSEKTLATIFKEKEFLPSKPGRDLCYLYLYWDAKTAAKNLGVTEPKYLLATWGEQSDVLISAGSFDIQKWGRANLKKEHFYCDKKEIVPQKRAKKASGQEIDLAGYDFLFLGDRFSRSH